MIGSVWSSFIIAFKNIEESSIDFYLTPIWHLFDTFSTYSDTDMTVNDGKGGRRWRMRVVDKGHASIIWLFFGYIEGLIISFTFLIFCSHHVAIC